MNHASLRFAMLSWNIWSDNLDGNDRTTADTRLLAVFESDGHAEDAQPFRERY
jgi:hypothetical protein